MFEHESAARPLRRHPVHHPVEESGNRAVIVFVTVCAKNRRPVLATVKTHQLLRAAWLRADHWLVGRYVVMPDHIQLYCAPNAMPPESLGNWVRFWKAVVSKSVGAPEGTLWQVDFWDTQLRQHESYAKKWDYVSNNPVRAGLVSQPNDWPYQGEMNLLQWHD